MANKENTAEDSERSALALKKRVEELEADGRACLAALRTSQTAQRALEEREAAGRAALEAHAQQAKEAFKKYEGYIEQAEEVTGFLAKALAASWDLSARALEALALGKAADLRQPWAALAAEETAAEKALERLAKSHNLARKGLFKDAYSRMWVRSAPQLDSLQASLDKLLEERQAADRIPAAARLPAEAAEPSPKSAVAALAMLREAVRAQGLGLDAAQGLASRCRELLEELQTRLVTLCSDAEGARAADFGCLAGFVGSALALADRLLAVDYAQLGALQAKNARLTQLRQHLSNLSAENEELLQRMRLTEFSLLEQNQAILALEASNQRLESALGKKRALLAETETRATELNGVVAEQMRALFELNEEIGRNECIVHDLNDARLQSCGALAQRQETHNALKAKCEQMQAELDARNAEISALEDVSAAETTRAEELCEWLFEQEQSARQAETKAAARVRVQARQALAQRLAA